MDYGIQNRNGCRNAVLEFVKHSDQSDLLINSNNPDSFIDLILDEYPIEMLIKIGYQAPKTVDYYTEDRLKFDRLKFVYAIYGEDIERKANSMNVNFNYGLKKVNAFKLYFCQKYNL